MKDHITKSHKCDDESTKLQKICVCNHRQSLLSFVRRERLPPLKEGEDRLVLVSLRFIITSVPTFFNDYPAFFSGTGSNAAGLLSAS